jgi:hypothetical protein
VPVSSCTGTANTAVVLLAGMLNETVLEAVENITKGSSTAPRAFGVNDSASVPDSGDGEGADKASAIGTCCVGFSSPGSPVNVTDGTLGLLIGSAKVRSALCCGERLSVTSTVKLNEPTVVGLPLSTPPGDKVSPCGNAPVRIDQR